MLDLQKATFSKRVSALLFDAIILFILAVGIGCVFSSVVGYDDTYAKYEAKSNEIIEKCGLTQKDVEKFSDYAGRYAQYLSYDKETMEYSFNIEETVLNGLTPEVQTEVLELKDMIGYVNLANKTMQGDEELNALYEKVIWLSISNISISIFFAFLILEFIIPLILKNGQTIGKKIFGIAVIKTNGVKITPFQLFVRSILSKYTLETMIPAVMIFMITYGIIGTVGLAVLLGIVISEVIIYFKSGNNSLIHDIMAVTVCVDMQSQLIFETEEELIAYKEKTAAENAGRIGYGGESVSSVYSSSNNTIEIDDETSSKIYKEDDESDSLPALTLSTISIGDETYVNTASAAPQVEDEDAAPEDTADESPEEETEETAEDTTAEEAAEEAAEEEADEPAEETEVENIEETEETDVPEAEDTAEETTEA